MDIEAKNFELKMTYNELWSIAFDVQRVLEYILETHWIYHQTKWKEYEHDRLIWLRNMFYALGRPEFYEHIFSKADDIFKEFNEKQGS